MKPRTKTILSYIYIVLVTAIVCSGFTAFFLKKANNKNTLQTVTVGLKWLNQAQFAGLYAAQDKHYFTDTNLQVQLIERDIHSEPVAKQVSEGKLNFGIVSANDFLKTVDTEKNITAVAAFFQYSPASIISLASANIHEPKDLQGKTIGIVTDTEEAKLFVKAILAETGTPLDSVTYKVVGYKGTQALTDKTVDAISVYRTGDVYDLEQQYIAYNTLLPERYGVDLYDDILITSTEFLHNNPATVRGLMTAITKGWEYVAKNPDEALDIVLKYDNPSYHNKEREKFILERSLPLMKPRSYAPFGRMTPGEWDATYELFKNNHLIGTYDIYRYFLPGYFFQNP